MVRLLVMEEGVKRERNEEGEKRRKRMGKWRGKEKHRGREREVEMGSLC